MILVFKIPIYYIIVLFMFIFFDELFKKSELRFITVGGVNTQSIKKVPAASLITMK